MFLDFAYLFEFFCRTKVQFVGSLITPIFDFVWPSLPFVLYSHIGIQSMYVLHSMSKCIYLFITGKSEPNISTLIQFWDNKNGHDLHGHFISVLPKRADYAFATLMLDVKLVIVASTLDFLYVQ